METLNYLGQGLGVAMTPTNLITVLIGTLIDTIAGLLPDLGPINGATLLVPVAFALDLLPETALILPVAVCLSCEYGERISSILFNIPGKASTVMTTLDGYPMARKGLTGVTLLLSTWNSSIGAFIATCGMVLFAPLLTKQAIAFGPAEYLTLMAFAIVYLNGTAGSEPLKALSAVLLGLFLSCVGIDANSGMYRSAGDSIYLADSIRFTVLILGLLSVSEISLLLEEIHHGQETVKATGRVMLNFKEVAGVFLVNLRCSVLGFVTGMLLDAGMTLVSAAAYITEKKLAGAKSEFGKDDTCGFTVPETVTGDTTCGAMVPMLTLDVPGLGTIVVVISVLTLYNITPDPLLPQQQPDTIWGLVASLFTANVMLIILNVPMVRVFTRTLAVPNWTLVPAITIITGTDIYDVHAIILDLPLMVDIGMLGYILCKLDFPLSPLLLGFILGGLTEQNLHRVLSISDGELGILWSNPISLVTWVLVAVVLLLPPVHAWCRRAARRATGLADA